MEFHVLHQDFTLWGTPYQKYGNEERSSGEEIYSDNLELCTYIYVHVFHMSHLSKCGCRALESNSRARETAPLTNRCR